MTHATSALRGTVLMACALAVACSGRSTTGGSAAAEAAGLPPGHPLVEATRLDPAENSAGTATRGIVLETVDGGGYTYAHVDLGGIVRWVAGPETALAVGDTVSMADMTGMGSFTSGTLNRTFDDLYFTGAFQKANATAQDVDVEHRGLVTEVIPAAGYVYLEVSRDDGTVWLAAPATTVEVGDSVGWNGGSLMTDFTSSTLNRTFAEIFFVGSVAVLK